MKFLKLKEFMLPNFLGLMKNDEEIARIDVGELDENEAREYWKKMESCWLQHVKQRKNNLPKCEYFNENSKTEEKPEIKLTQIRHDLQQFGDNCLTCNRNTWEQDVHASFCSVKDLRKVGYFVYEGEGHIEEAKALAIKEGFNYFIYGSKSYKAK